MKEEKSGMTKEKKKLITLKCVFNNKPQSDVD